MSIDGVKSIPDVFLSYSHDNAEVVEKVAEYLAEKGFSCWIDKDQLRGGDSYNPVIDKAIDDCRVFITFLSHSYVNKKYCNHEFDRAFDRQKSILSVCIDDVNEHSNRENAYMFSFSAGKNIIGFGKGLSDEYNAEKLAEDIANSVVMSTLKRYLSTGDENDLPPVSTPEYIFARLRYYHEKQYKQNGNYALNEIRSELFPAMQDSDMNVVYRDEENKSSSLISFLEKENTKKHVFLMGEGGMGKTVSLLKTCEYLLSKKINAIYVPLSKIDKERTLNDYLKDTVCKGNERIWNDLDLIMKMEYKDTPYVYLFLDGINEIARDYEETFIKKTLEQYINDKDGIRIVMTSRWFDSATMHNLKSHISTLEMQHLDDKCIKNYLCARGLPPISDERILSVIRTPLLLTLYSDVELHKEKYSHIPDISLFENPDTAGKILHNFFQTQLFRAAEEENFDKIAHLVLLEYYLPCVAYHMVKNQSMEIKEDDIWNIVDTIEDKDDRYIWYERDKLRKLIRGRGRGRVDANALVDLAENALHFLHKTEDGDSFLHQTFRDYFAAYHIANEIWAYEEDEGRTEDCDSILEADAYNDEILSFISDITKENEATPILSENGWTFPGKDGTEPSESSPAEKILYLWKERDDEKARNAVYNLFGIMKTGRQNNLASCDFSDLDMRKCTLNGCRFTEWFKEDFYPSCFDRAYIDRQCFITDGHEASVSSLCSDKNGTIFSGDLSGTVKFFDMENGKCLKTFQPQQSAVVDMAYNEKNSLLAILYQNCMVIYDTSCDKMNFIPNESRSKNFRYVDFDKDGELIFSYDMEPLFMRHLDGTLCKSVPKEFSFDLPAKCAKMNPARPEFIRSNMMQLMSVCTFGKNGRWGMHPALEKSINFNIDFKADMFLFTETLDTVVSERLENIKNKIKDNHLCFKSLSNNQKFLNSYIIVLENKLFVYDYYLKKVLSRKDFYQNIDRVVYTNADLVYVEIGDTTIVLNHDLSLRTAFLRLRNAGITEGNVSSIFYHPDGDRVLIAANTTLIEYDTKTFSPQRKKTFAGNVNDARYDGDTVLVATSSDIVIMDEDFSEISTIKGSQIRLVGYLVDDYEGGGFYLLSSNGELKKMTYDLTVQSIRKTAYRSIFTWAKDRLTNQVQMIFKPQGTNKRGNRYTYETDQKEPLGWRYRILDIPPATETQLYKMDNNVMTVSKTPPYKKLTYKNHSGIFIFRCSFDGIKGTLAEEKNEEFIKQNGGIINGSKK